MKNELRNEGVNPQTVSSEDKLLWLKNGTYVPFAPSDWEAIQNGKARL